MRKYRNQPTVLDGEKFDSKAEAARWSELRLLERAGHIRGLERQVKYELAPSVKFSGSARAQPPLRLIVDFAYWEGDKRICEDVKSPATVTTAFTIKRHLLLAVHGLQVRLSA